MKINFNQTYASIYIMCLFTNQGPLMYIYIYVKNNDVIVIMTDIRMHSISELSGTQIHSLQTF